MVIYRDCGVSFCDKLQQDCTCVYLEKKIRRGEKKTYQERQMVFIENILYQSVTNCNKTAYLEKNQEGKKKKSVTRATNGFYRE